MTIKMKFITLFNLALIVSCLSAQAEDQNRNERPAFDLVLSIRSFSSTFGTGLGALVHLNKDIYLRVAAHRMTHYGLLKNSAEYEYYPAGMYDIGLERKIAVAPKMSAYIFPAIMLTSPSNEIASKLDYGVLVGSGFEYEPDQKARFFMEFGYAIQFVSSQDSKLVSNPAYAMGPFVSLGAKLDLF